MAGKILIDEDSKQIFDEIGCGKKSTVSSALVNLTKLRGQIHTRRQTLWVSGGVGSCWGVNDWENRENVKLHAEASKKLERTDQIITELKKHDSTKNLKVLQSEITLHAQQIAESSEKKDVDS